MKPGFRVTVSATLLLAAIAFVQLYSHGEAVPIQRPLDQFPMAVGEWQARETTLLSEKILDILRPTDYLQRRYEDPLGRDAFLYVGYWEAQKKGAQIHSPKNCLPGGGWEPLDAKVVPVDIGNERAIEVNRYVLQNGGDLLVVGYWFLAQGEPVAGELGAKIAMVKNSILHNRSDGALVRVTAPARGTPDEAWALVEDYVRAIVPVLDGFLPG